MNFFCCCGVIASLKIWANFQHWSMITAKPRSPALNSSPARHRVWISAPAPPQAFGTPSVRNPSVSACRIQSQGMRSAAVGRRSRRSTSGRMTCLAKARAISRQRNCSAVNMKSIGSPRRKLFLRPYCWGSYARARGPTKADADARCTTKNPAKAGFCRDFPGFVDLLLSGLLFLLFEPPKVDEEADDHREKADDENHHPDHIDLLDRRIGGRLHLFRSSESPTRHQEHRNCRQKSTHKPPKRWFAQCTGKSRAILCHISLTLTLLICPYPGRK